MFIHLVLRPFVLVTLILAVTMLVSINATVPAYSW